MKASEYPALQQFLAAYFHQDWMLDDLTSMDVVRRFARNNPVGPVRGDLQRLLSLLGSEDDLEQIFEESRAAYDPRADGVSLGEWLASVENELARFGKSPRLENSG